MEYDYSAAVFIGRFQPFHSGHLDVVKNGLSLAEKLIIVVGSSNAAPTIKNPFSFEERQEIIRLFFTKEENERIHVVPVRDYFNVENFWLTDVQQKVYSIVNRAASIALLGQYKDNSSYYLKMFPQWDFQSMNSSAQLNATDIREALFKDSSVFDDSCEVIKWFDVFKKNFGDKLSDWLANNFLLSAKHMQLCKEYDIIKKGKEQWSSSPFPPTFVTVDSVVVQSGHILLVKRKFEPGKGLLALPGGYLKQNERIEDGALRELREETGIRVSTTMLKSHVKESKVFDYPGRSLKGRVITHAYYVKLPDSGDLPEVKGHDDAEKAFWLPLMDVSKRENEFFEDHFAIISWFIGR